MKPDDAPADQSNSPNPQPVAPSTVEKINDQWKTKADYAHTQASQSPLPGLGHAVESSSKVTQYAKIALGISVLLFLLTVATPLGDVFSYTGTADRALVTKPLLGITTIMVLLSYFTMVISGIITSVKKSKKRSNSLWGLALGLFLVFNPLGLFIVWSTISCNFHSCAGS